jgi:hypothetical protein
VSKYDDAEYLFLEFETELDNEAAGTHIGMYLAWAAQRDLLASSAHADLERLRARQISGRKFLFDHCDGKLMAEDFSFAGKAFADWYYERGFVADYQRVFKADFPSSGHPTDDFCGIPDTWGNFDRMARVLDRRYAQWLARPGRGGNESTPQRPSPSASPGSGAAAKVELNLVPMDAQPPPPGSEGTEPSGLPGSRPSPATAAPNGRSASTQQARLRAVPGKPWGLHWGHLALLVGAVAIILLLLLTTAVSAEVLRASALVLALVGAWGVWRCARDLRLGSGLRLLLSALAAIPVAGSVVCIMLLLWVVRAHEGG